MKQALAPVQVLGPALESGSWQPILDAFLAANMDSDNTRQAYRRRIREALVSMKAPSLFALTGAQLADYRARLIADGRGPATHAQGLAALRSFLRWSGTFEASRTVRRESGVYQRQNCVRKKAARSDLATGRSRG